MELTAAHLRYLLAIYEVSQTHLDICSRSIAEKLNVTKPSVVRIMNLLMDRGMIVKEHYGKIYLTDRGIFVAKAVRAQLETVLTHFPPVRIDMTEYMEKFSVSRLIGAPPGYVGYDEGGQLTEAVRRKPYSVVLFDEVEKAHPDVFNILLQVLDDGRITDSQGRTVDFKNTVIILTSNLGSDIILNDLEQRRAQGSNELSEDAKHQIDLLLKSKFRPEFLNRLDEIVYYKSLTKDEMRKIVDLQLQDLRNRMEEGKHLKLEVTTAAKDFIIDSAYDSVYGARPIKRFIQSRVETLIAKAIIQGRYAEGSTLTVDYDGNALVLK